MADLVQSVKAQGLEGLIAKRRNSRYEPGLRSGAWQKRRVNLGQEFVIGGYTIGGATFDALVFGYYEHGNPGRWGAGLTAKKMADCCRWLKPALVGQFEFVEWTPDNHLRHSRFIALHDDKVAHDVVREEHR